MLSTLGLALRAGSVAVGEEPVGAAARAKKSRVIFTAQDAASSSVRRANSFARAGSCLCLTIPADKASLGSALGRTSCAMCAVTDIGFAQSIVQKLAAADPARYAPAAEALAVKAARARKRREEQLRHEKNLRQGKRRVHEAPETHEAHEVTAPRETQERPRRAAQRPSKDKRRRPRHAPVERYENARPVKKGKGSPHKGGK